MKLTKPVAIALVTASVGVVLAQRRAGGVDYLSPDLRARVETLKSEASWATRDREVLAARLATLWEWANAYSLTGGVIPGEFPQSTANANRSLRQLPDGGAQTPIGQISNFIARYTREFQIKDENPNALGTLTLSEKGPFRAGELVTIDQTYTVGELPMVEGGGIILGRRQAADLQVNDPSKAGYLTIRSSNPKARFEIQDPRGPGPRLLIRNPMTFRLHGTSLEKGETITIRYGDKSGGGPGMRMQSSSNDHVAFTIVLDLEGKGWPLAPAWPWVEVIGDEEIRYVNAIVPSVVEPGERFTLVVRSEDRWKNLSSAKAGKMEVLLDGQAFRAIASGSPAVLELDDVSIAKEGVHRFTVRSADGDLQGLSNPIRVEKNPANRIYWGETHGHTAFAEGQGSPDGYFKFGRDVARLDFLALSEHDTWMDDFEWNHLKEMVRKYRIPGKFTTILSFEWTSRFAYGGHHNVFFRDVPNRLRVPNQNAPLLNELYEGLRAENDTDDVLVIPHAHQPGDWSNSDNELERLVEIQSGHGTFDWFGSKYLDNGYRIGFVGASDNHGGHPGYSGIGNQQLGGLAAALAQENSAEAIFDSLRKRATYATTGERIILDTTLNGARMGEAQADSERRKIEARVNGTAPIDAVDVIKNGEIVYSKRYLETDLEDNTQLQLSFEASTRVHGERYVPRGSRVWKGVISAKGAKIIGYENPWHHNPATYSTSLEGGKLHFGLNTRGRSSSILLKLRGATAKTEIVVDMEQTRELRGSGGYQREVLTLPANTQTFRLGDLRSDIDRREYKALEQTDALSAQLIPAGASLDADFSYTDQDAPQPGDYYYLRVRQVDGAMAWSSPFWVGEEKR